LVRHSIYKSCPSNQLKVKLAYPTLSLESNQPTIKPTKLSVHPEHPSKQILLTLKNRHAIALLSLLRPSRLRPTISISLGTWRLGPASAH
jgi:hypothetical protein